MDKPLNGFRVIEFSHMVMGPSCGLILGDMGADVIKVEPSPVGDKTRELKGSGAGFFAAMNRNKRSVLLDLKNPEQLKIAYKLVASADVVIENFRPGAMDKLGLGFEDLKAVKPDIIYMSAKGFLEGPYQNRTALDEVVQMMAGLAYMTGPEGRPLRAGASVNDIMGGMFGVIGILSALLNRGKDSEAVHIESGLYENCAFLATQHMAQKEVTGKAAAPMPSRIPSWTVYDIFDTQTAQVFVGVVTDSQWLKFCQTFGLEDLLSDPALAQNKDRVLVRERFLPRIHELFLKITAEDLMQKCEAINIPFAPIRRPEDLFDDQHLVQSGGLLTINLPGGGQATLPALPMTINGQRFTLDHDIPKAGEHTDEILRELGIDIS